MRDATSSLGRTESIAEARLGKTAVSVVLLLGSQFAQATTYTVTNTGDNSGVNPAAHAGTGTLRQAIVDSNADGGVQNVIDFGLSGSGPFTISLAAQLPLITSNVGVDGFSQSGSQSNTNTPNQGGLNSQLMIEIDGGNTVGYGFYISNNVAASVAGLVINGFTSSAVEQNASGSTLLVYGNFIGAQVDGHAFPAGYGNPGVGVRIDAGTANIGGVLPGQRNLISGNQNGNIYLGNLSVTAVVEGNLIGPDASGTVAIGGGTASNWPGIVLPGNIPTIRIGCTGAGCSDAGAVSRNVISGNHTYGMAIWDTYGQGTGGLQIKGNFIGTDWTGMKPLPNGDTTAGCPNYCGGIQLQGSPTLATPASVIGGFGDGEGNLIAYNLGPGIAAYGGSIGASFDNHGNAIHHNGYTDIGFNLASWVANDAGDADSGTNHQQNYPVIESASVVSGNLDVTYHVDSATADSTYPLRIDFYVDVDDGSGEYLVSDTYPSVSAQVSRSVSLPLPVGALPLVGFVAAATDSNGYSSEFSPAFVFDRIFASGLNH